MKNFHSYIVSLSCFTVLNQQQKGRKDRPCSLLSSTVDKKLSVFWFLLNNRLVCNCFSFIKNSLYTLYTQVLGWCLAEWTLSLHFTLKYFYLCSWCILVSPSPWTTIWGAWNVRCTNVYANMLLGAWKNVYQDF